MKIIGERLRSLRESVRLSQAKLAKEFDVSQSALARYEIDDSTPSPEVFLKYADYFDVSLDYIFGRTDDPYGMIYNNSSPRPPEGERSEPEGRAFWRKGRMAFSENKPTETPECPEGSLRCAGGGREATCEAGSRRRKYR